MRQILHVDRLCNECGNCAAFCPYESRPYEEKLTLFLNEEDFMDSENSGFLVLKSGEAPVVRVRLNGKVGDFDLSKPNGLERGIECFIMTVVRDYSYLL
jgi:putative selenate reductase